MISNSLQQKYDYAKPSAALHAKQRTGMVKERRGSPGLNFPPTCIQNNLAEQQEDEEHEVISAPSLPLPPYESHYQSVCSQKAVFLVAQIYGCLVVAYVKQEEKGVRIWLLSQQLSGFF
ncbi:hypothetical protein CEXT_534421 [Caerostris extrusa]|uniref:Uncharacterized protein n=1 Tax=Caerostris extrusa TaxID=172846 RepID=A0AAV4XFK7_CAEEX|nr:hypothetical protein CEXT_534421 [Caerostris extrusa]